MRKHDREIAMISGSGLLATAFRSMGARKDVFIHAAGVSNSQCRDVREFQREEDALQRSLAVGRECDIFVYFSTCSVNDPASSGTPYVIHKLAMETRVRSLNSHLILRLPQVAGRTPNPHTLLNYLYGRIARGERFAVWRNARRNIIDCDDVQALGIAAIDAGICGCILNVANRRDYGMLEIVETMERVTGGHAVYDLLDCGVAYAIDTSALAKLMVRAETSFSADYLERVIQKYYGHAR